MIDRRNGNSAGAAARVIAVLLIAVAPAGTATAQSPPDREARPGPSAGRLAGRVGGLVQGEVNRRLKQVRAAWPDPPEWAAMLLDILEGSQLGPGEGWFKKAVAQTRYGWEC